MVDISLKNYTDAKVCTIKIGNKKLFWVKVNDVQNGLGGKDMSVLVRKEIHSIFETKNPTKDQVKKYKRHENELHNNSNATLLYVRSDLMSRIIKNCRVEKKGAKKKRYKSGFMLHNITMCKEESVTIKIIDIFEQKNTTTKLCFRLSN